MAWARARILWTWLALGVLLAIGASSVLHVLTIAAWVAIPLWAQWLPTWLVTPFVVAVSANTLAASLSRRGGKLPGSVAWEAVSALALSLGSATTGVLAALRGAAVLTGQVGWTLVGLPLWLGLAVALLAAGLGLRDSYMAAGVAEAGASRRRPGGPGRRLGRQGRGQDNDADDKDNNNDDDDDDDDDETGQLLRVIA